MSVGIQHMFVVSLDVAVGICGYTTWIYNNVFLDRQKIVIAEFAMVSYLPSQYSRVKCSSVTKIFGILLINKNIVLNIKF